MEVDHILPTALGGQDAYANWQLLHRHCHDQKTAAEHTAAVAGARVKRQTSEAPDDGKPSRPVLEAGGGR